MSAPETARQAQLIAIARRLFAAHGYEGTSLRDIAEAAGITKATLYHHFPNKSELYCRISVDDMRSLLQAVTTAVHEAQGAVARIYAFMLASAEYFESDRDQWMVNSAAFWHTHDIGYPTETVDYRDAYERLLRRCVEEGVETGVIQAETDAALAARLLLSCLSHLPRWYRPDGPLSAREIMQRFVDMTLQGVLVQSSRELALAGRFGGVTV